MEKPRKLETGCWFGGRSHPCWLYKEVPPGMRRAEAADIRLWRPVLYRVRYGPDAGGWYATWVRPSSRELFLRMVSDGEPVYVKA